MRNALDTLYKASAALAAFALIAIAAIVFAQVGLNLIDSLSTALFGAQMTLLIPSYALFSGYALGWATFLSLGYGFRQAVHIRVTILEGRLPLAARRLTLTLVSILGAVAAGFMAWHFAHLTYESWLWGDKASGLIKLPLWIPQIGMSAGLVIFFISCLDTMVEMLRFGRSDALKLDTTIEDAVQ